MQKTAARPWSELWREWVTDKATGLVLEIGAGDGVNLPFYHDTARVIATEPDAEALGFVEHHSARISLLQASAEEFPFPAATFDAAVGTLVFCSIPDPARGFRELRRVLKPGASLRLVEHVRAKNPLGRALMLAANPAWRWMNDGCNLTRDTLTTLRAAGFQVIQVRERYRGLIIGIDAANPL